MDYVKDGAGVYMVSSNNAVSMDGDRIDSNISNATRVSPATVSINKINRF